MSLYRNERMYTEPPKTYDITKTNYHGYNDDYWRKRSEGYSQSYSWTDKNEENPFSPLTEKSSPLDKYAYDPVETRTKYFGDSGFNNNMYKYGEFGSKDQGARTYTLQEEPMDGDDYTRGKLYGNMSYDRKYERGYENVNEPDRYDADLETRYSVNPEDDVIFIANREDSPDDGVPINEGVGAYKNSGPGGSVPDGAFRDYRVMNGGLYNVHDAKEPEETSEYMNGLHNGRIDDCEDEITEQKEERNEVYANPELIESLLETEPKVSYRHKLGYTKFVSVIPEENRYVSAVNYLPERIELRLCGARYSPKKCYSIPDLYNIVLKPLPRVEENVNVQTQSLDYAFDDKEGILRYRPPKHDHLKEMYVTQYTHNFDSEEPKSHIAGWKVDVEPNGIPHERSRMCVMKSPVVSKSRSRPKRPKSAPPKLYQFDFDDEDVRPTQRVDVAESLSSFPRGGDDDASSIGYAPSDDTSDSSAAYFGSFPRHHEAKFGYSRPKLIRLSGDFPGIRNLEKMRRKKQSMGSTSSGAGIDSTSSFRSGSRSLSSLPESRSLTSLPRTTTEGDYGFSFALTSPTGGEQERGGNEYESYDPFDDEEML
ncbi:uncharacterized protein LOC5520623 [Nematostella vectensis]|uniref:uncharacterized protein LOC5520623 n=1 Tax=Nematostella vectensis TaxID=45351 RepID=UPI00207778FD|nr:uncharacterized protein LOC5520623 [Nematostella vectensis]XP_032221582.2 uncharacterized protein LOC5520623 [Nematostella vectensis]XP_032221583.2 uncharacterized protein LOC5520623 [Nematostella vectensis]XP_032221584.2 uncharacterized protein LOC5520623 [Nematostella vectensis]